MIYRHQFRVNASLARVAEFHSRSASMAAITPPPIIARLHNAPPSGWGRCPFTGWRASRAFHPAALPTANCAAHLPNGPTGTLTKRSMTRSLR